MFLLVAESSLLTNRTNTSMESVVRPHARPRLWLLMEAMMSPGSSSGASYMLHPFARSCSASASAAFCHPLHVRLGYLLATIGRFLGVMGAIVWDLTARAWAVFQLSLSAASCTVLSGQFGLGGRLCYGCLLWTRHDSSHRLLT